MNQEEVFGIGDSCSSAIALKMSLDTFLRTPQISAMLPFINHNLKVLPHQGFLF